MGRYISFEKGAHKSGYMYISIIKLKWLVNMHSGIFRVWLISKITVWMYPSRYFSPALDLTQPAPPTLILHYILLQAQKVVNMEICNSFV